ncbi:hypothetical protein AB0A76_09195 [Streptomyces exfoliatus]|uniref:Uncharacterized protein n=1 Tax=Streptomyces exfoliatus TaxID=1905 RepID=A0ABV3CT32_STREX
MTGRPAHDPRRCRLCAPLRHPSQRDTRRALPLLLPAQTRRSW